MRLRTTPIKRSHLSRVATRRLLSSSINCHNFSPHRLLQQDAYETVQVITYLSLPILGQLRSGHRTAP